MSWWHRKYKIPPRQIEEYTYEELVIENFEDYFIKKPDEVGKFFQALESRPDEEWDGSVAPEVEDVIKKRKGKVDLSKYQSDKELSEDEVQNILDNVGKDLPMSRAKNKSNVGDDFEFDESF